MALSIGDLTAYLRADDSNMQRGLTGARLALLGLRRDTDGTLRDMRGRFVSESDAASRSLRSGIGTAAGAVVRAVARIGPALGGISVGLPVVAAATTAIMGLASGATAAGLAVGAFAAASKHQLTGVTEASDAAKKADDAHEKVLVKKKLAEQLAAKGGEEYKKALQGVKTASRAAAEADAAAKAELAGLPPATRKTAVAFAGLKNDYEDWSDSLSSSTMPVFTKGIEILRDLLPQLTPFVKSAANALSGFMDEIAAGVQSGGFKQWMADMAKAAGPALTNFLTVAKNLLIGLMALFQAFLPQSESMTGGLVKATTAFRNWATSLQDSEGFRTFLQLAQEGGGIVGQLALAAVKLLVALGPLIGVTTQVALALAKFINSLPPGVVQALAFAIGGAVIAMKLYAVYSRIAGTVSAVMGSRVAAAAGRFALAAVRATGAFVRIAATATVNAARTAAVWAVSAARMAATWLVQILRVAARTAASFVMMAARAVAWAAIMAAQWLIAMGPVGWIIAGVVALIAVIVLIATKTTWFQTIWAAVWGWLKSATAAAVAGILAAISWLGRLPGMVWGWIKSMAAGAIIRFLSFVAWVRGLPGRVFGALKSLGGRLLLSAAMAVLKFRQAAISKFLSVVSWVRGVPGRIRSALGNLASLLVSKGRDVVRGLWNGIKSMGGWLKSSLINFARSMIPGPIAKALGIGSPSRVMAKQVGQWIPAGIVSGIESGQGQLDRTMSNLVDPVGAGVGAGVGARGVGAGMGGAQTVTVRIEVAGPEDVRRLIRKIVRTDGRGSVQTAFGT